MRFYTLSFALILILVGILEAKKVKKDDQQWREEKYRKLGKHSKMAMKKQFEDLKENKPDYDYDKTDLALLQGYNPSKNLNLKSHELKHYFGKNKKLHKAKKSKNKNKKGMKKLHKKTMAWLNIRSDEACDLKCKPFEVCVSGPVVSEPICIHKKDLKKSMKLFHRYHRKEIKAWRKFNKKHYKQSYKTKEEKFGRKEADDLTALKARKLKKLGKMGHFDKQFPEKGKPHQKSHHKTSGPVCGSSELGQMKTRMTGWFHLLHGQDKEARKAHHGSLTKFYKHVSVKKELREHDGEKCECMKSAMWQFDQMDKNKDDHLTDQELSMLEENSLEPCMRPYLKSCDRNGDKKIGSNEWCCCFTNNLPPCYKKMNQIRNAGKPVTYMPRCDKEGYFMQEQCKGEKDRGMVCWCVDYNGNEYKDTATNGRAHCQKMKKHVPKDQMVPLV